MQHQSLYPAQLDTFENHGSRDGIGLDIDWQKSDELSSNELDLITDAILELERQLLGGIDAVNVAIADAGGRYTGTEVEAALQEIAGAGRTVETVMANATAIAAIKKPNIRFCIHGTAKVATKVIQALAGQTLTISKVKIYADTAPTGQTLKVDVNLNGVTIFTVQANRPTIAIAANAADSGAPDITAVAEGDRLSVDIDQVGNIVAGGDDLIVTIVLA